MAYPALSLLIGGHWRQGGGPQLAVLNPASGEVIGRFVGADADDIAAAIAAAEAAFQIWRQVSAVEREALLRRAADAVRAAAEPIAGLIVAENGKPIAEARAEIQAAAEVFDFYAGEARRIYGRVIPARQPQARLTTLREPVGIVAAFAPWNFPAINLVRKLAPALAAGCVVIAKPAEETPATGLALAECLARAGLPDGVFNILYGNPADISSALIEAPAVRKVSFTGSTSVGRIIASQAGAALKRVTMELGGHAPVIVCADADPERAGDMAAAAKFRNAGQTCNSASRFYVHRSLYERFVTRFSAVAAAITVGDGADPATTMGPLSNARRLDALDALVKEARGLGARLVTGGGRLARPGFFFQPTVLADVPAAAAIMQQEPFGPVAPIVPFDDLDEAIGLANGTRFGLASYVITEHAPTARRLSREIRAGVVGINTFVASLPESPFGGIGDSGFGHEGGPEGLEPYLQTRFVNEA